MVCVILIHIFNMLDFALAYRVAIDKIMSNQDLNLHKHELQDDEWEVTENLCDSLKAHLAGPFL